MGCHTVSSLARLQRLIAYQAYFQSHFKLLKSLVLAEGAFYPRLDCTPLSSLARTTAMLRSLAFTSDMAEQAHTSSGRCGAGVVWWSTTKPIQQRDARQQENVCVCVYHRSVAILAPIRCVPPLVSWHAPTESRRRLGGA